MTERLQSKPRMDEDGFFEFKREPRIGRLPLPKELETEIRANHVTRTSGRFLMGTVDAKFLSPQKQSVTDQDKHALVTKTEKDLDADALEKVSVESRTSYWEKRQAETGPMTVGQQVESWNASIAEWINRGKSNYGVLWLGFKTDNDGLLTSQRKKIAYMENVNGTQTKRTEEITVFPVVETIRKKYFTDKSNIHQFVADIAEGCRENGEVKLDLLTDGLSELYPLLASFGTDFAVDKLVADYAMSYALLTQKEEYKEAIADRAGQAVALEVDSARKEGFKRLHQHLTPHETQHSTKPEPAEKQTKADALPEEATVGSVSDEYRQHPPETLIITSPSETEKKSPAPQAVEQELDPAPTAEPDQAQEKQIETAHLSPDAQKKLGSTDAYRSGTPPEEIPIVTFPTAKGQAAVPQAEPTSRPLGLPVEQQHMVPKSDADMQKEQQLIGGRPIRIMYNVPVPYPENEPDFVKWRLEAGKIFEKDNEFIPLNDFLSSTNKTIKQIYIRTTSGNIILLEKDGTITDSLKKTSDTVFGVLKLQINSDGSFVGKDITQKAFELNRLTVGEKVDLGPRILFDESEKISEIVIEYNSAPHGTYSINTSETTDIARYFKSRLEN